MKNNIEVVQDIVNFWQTMKTDNQHNTFKNRIKNTRFGTYGTIDVLEVAEKWVNELQFINKYHRNEFFNEVKNILKCQ
jgi:uncharacterized protein (DUF488 family)